MKRSQFSWICFLWGLLFFSSLPFIHHIQAGYYAKNEALFSCPIRSSYQKVLLRNDAYGKGAFAAPRNGGRTHQGIDLLGQMGDPILASKSGRVLRVENQPKGYGLVLEIIHPGGSSTIYAHLSKITVKPHDWVHMGDSIGLTGKSGNAANPKILPHLHFEIKNKGKALDPIPLLSFKLQ